MNDPINPDHYKQGGVEVIELTERMSFVCGNLFKYVARAKYKGVLEEDLNKALWYLARYINTWEPDFTITNANELTKTMLIFSKYSSVIPDKSLVLALRDIVALNHRFDRQKCDLVTKYIKDELELL